MMHCNANNDALAVMLVMMHCYNRSFLARYFNNSWCIVQNVQRHLKRVQQFEYNSHDRGDGQLRSVLLFHNMARDVYVHVQSALCTLQAKVCWPLYHSHCTFHEWHTSTYSRLFPRGNLLYFNDQSRPHYVLPDVDQLKSVQLGSGGVHFSETCGTAPDVTSATRCRGSARFREAVQICTQCENGKYVA